MKLTADEIRQLLKSRDPAVRMRAIRLCDRLVEPERTQLLCLAIKDKSSYFAADAALRLVSAAEPFAAEPVHERFQYLMADGLKRDPGCYIRAHLAVILGNMRYLEAVPTLRDGLRVVQIENFMDTAGPLRGNCAMALASIPFGDPVVDLTFLLFYEGNTPYEHSFFDQSSKISAVKALVRLGQVQSSIAIFAKLCDGREFDTALLADCMAALMELKHPRAIDILAGFLTSANINIAASAAVYLVTAMQEEYLPAILALVPGLSGDLLKGLLIALYNSRSPRAAEAVTRLQETGTDEVREILADLNKGHV